MPDFGDARKKVVMQAGGFILSVHQGWAARNFDGIMVTDDEAGAMRAALSETASWHGRRIV